MSVTEVATRLSLADKTPLRHLANDVFLTTFTYKRTVFTTSKTGVRSDIGEQSIYHCDFYVLTSCFIDYTASFSYTDRDYLSNRA
jgi:hypothetical protein